jgi:hypothetical protein
VIHGEEEILRKVYGPVTEQGVWRIRPHQELGELYKTPHLSPDIKRRGLTGWVSWSEWMKQGYLRKFLKKLQGRRKVEKPRMNGWKMWRMINKSRK